jgi:hypothetical protein
MDIKELGNILLFGFGFLLGSAAWPSPRHNFSLPRRLVKCSSSVTFLFGANTTQHPLDSRSCCSVTVVIRTNLRDGFISPLQPFALNVRLQLQLQLP